MPHPFSITMPVMKAATGAIRPQTGISIPVSKPRAWTGFPGANALPCRASARIRMARAAARASQDERDQSTLQSTLLSALASAAVHIAGAATCLQAVLPPPAFAVLNSPNVQIPRTVDAALRRSIPPFNPVAADAQSKLEEIAYLLRIPQRKPWGKMAENTSGVSAIAKDRSSLLAGVKPEKMDDANKIVDDLEESLQRLLIAVNGKDAEKTSLRVARALKDIADIEILEAPGLPFIVNRSYNTLPRLEGRAVVELEVAKADGSAAFVDLDLGRKKETATVSITVDGYSAPISAGKFLCNVRDGNYNNQTLFANFQSDVVGTKSDQTVPLEILPAGEFEPLYRSPLDVQGGELPVLPLSISGAVAFMHVDGTESVVDSNRFFVYKFDKTQAGLAGLSFDEGTFGVFGYVTSGLDILSRLENGDIIKSVKVVSGEDRLVLPPGSQQQQ